MERDEFKILVKGMKAVYAQPTFLPDKDAFDVWYELLKDIPYKVANVAIQKYMLTEKFPPTIADIREKASSLMTADTSISELEAWALVRKAIGRSGYHAEEEFAKLPKAIQRAVGNPANLREWSMMETKTVETVEQSHFISTYRTVVKRMNEDAKLPTSVKNLIEAMKPESITQKQVQAIPEKPEVIEKPKGVPMPERLQERLDEILNGG